jgi:hypothetical protein
MAVSAKVGAFSTGTGAAATTVAVSGVGFQPGAIIFWWSGRTETSDAIGRATHQRGFGFAVSASDRQAVGSMSTDAAAASDCGRITRNDACIATVDAAGAVLALMDLQSMDADGFTLVVDDAFPSSLRVHYLALAGMTNAATGWFATPTSTGNADVVTSLAFQPDLVLFMSCDITSDPPNASASRGHILFGAAVSSSQRAIWNGGSDEAAPTMSTGNYCNDIECLGFLNNAATSVAYRADFVSFLSNGFRLNILEGTTARRTHYLALKGGNYRVGSLTTQTDTTTPIVQSSFGFAPSAALFLSHGNTESTQDTAQANDRLSIGAASSTTNRGAQGTLDENGVANAEVTTAVEHDAVYVNINTSSAIDGLMDMQSFDSDGFTTIMDDADASGKFVWYVAFGPAAAAAKAPPPFQRATRVITRRG